jgi:di/tricarboxylate transporter
MVLRPGGYTTATFARFGVPLILGSLVSVWLVTYLLTQT